MISIAKPLIGKEEEEAVLSVLRSGQLVQGPKAKEFESMFAEYCGAKHAIATSSGTSALMACVHSLGIQEGDEVITTPFTFIATAHAIFAYGAKPVFVDINEKTFNIDSSKIESAITKKTKAIMPVDLYGLPYEYDSISKIAKKYSLSIIEDACQAVGAEYHGKKTGVLGDLAAFSLYPTKNITSGGEGGIITTSNDYLAEKIRYYINIGQKARYVYDSEVGVNFRMPELHAAISIEQLKKLDFISKKRNENAQFLLSALKGLPNVILPQTPKGLTHVYHQFTIRITNGKRDYVAEELKKREIGIGIYYPQPIHLTPPYKKIGYKKGDFAISEKIASEVISIPVHPLLAQKDLDYIAKNLKEILSAM